MNRHSLVLRLGLAAAALLVLALTLAGAGLSALFEREIEQRALAELGQTTKFLAAQVRVDANGEIGLDTAPTDPRFETAYGGLYWQISEGGTARLRSRSLWDFALPAETRKPGERWDADVPGPNGSVLLGFNQVIALGAGGQRVLGITAAVDRADIETARASFGRLLVFSLLALGAILVLAMAVFVRLALRPFDTLGRGLQAIRSGDSRVLAGSFPTEVQPVVDDLNRLIAFQDAALERAKTHAGDLAHGLKTPLAILSATARRAAAEGRPDLAEAIEEPIADMTRLVERVLARARAGITAALGRGRVEIAPVAEKIVRALERLPAERPLTWTCAVPPGVCFPGDEGDLTEMLGNLLDNARKWARSRIALSGTAVPGAIVLRVEDDGPGLSPEQAARVGRGQRWDETRPGTGFGLAITRDLAEAYGGQLELARSEQGGLAAVLTMPLRR